MNSQKNNYELIKFEDGEFSLDVNVSPFEETVWLTKTQIAELYNRDRSVISKHIKKYPFGKGMFRKKQRAKNAHCKFR